MGLIHQSVDDIRSTLRTSKNNYTIDELQHALQQEELGNNPVGKKRQTVAKMISNVIKARLKQLDKYYTSGL